MVKNYKLIISGRVQGVGFRYTTKHLADELGIKGYVQNIPDSTVAIIVEGEEVTIKQFINLLNSSPGNSHVEKIDMTINKLMGLKEFKVF